MGSPDDSQRRLGPPSAGVGIGWGAALLAALAVGCGSADTAGPVAVLAADCAEGQEQVAPNVCVDPDDPDGRKAADVVEKLRKRYQLNASIFGIWKGDEELVTGAVGQGLIPNVAASRDMHFRICNVTETMTTTLLLQYVDEGRLSLDEPVSKWFPDLPRADEVTLQMLASSSSGYPDYVTSKPFIEVYGSQPFHEWQPEELVRIGVDQPGVFAPGKNWAFSDTNFLLLGEILTKAGGEPLAAQLQEKTFEPLGLEHTAMQDTPEIPPPVLHGYASERGQYEDSTFWNPSWAAGTGNVTSNLSDLGAWLRALGTGELLSAKSHELQIGPGNADLGTFTDAGYYGMGTVVSNHWILLNPQCGGYEGLAAYYPPEGLALAVYSTPAEGNSEENNDSESIFGELVKLLGPSEAPDLPQRKN